MKGSPGEPIVLLSGYDGLDIWIGMRRVVVSGYPGMWIYFSAAGNWRPAKTQLKAVNPRETNQPPREDAMGLLDTDCLLSIGA